MRLQVPYIAKGPEQLTVPGGAVVFLFGMEDRDGMATVIYDGKVKRHKKTHLMQNEPNRPFKWRILLYNTTDVTLNSQQGRENHQTSW